MIESFVEGRIRLRSGMLSDAVFAGRLSSKLMEIPGALKADINTRTCGILLEYDRSILPLASLMKAAPILSKIEALACLTPDERLAALEDILSEFLKLISS